jgi:hypothetical protein
MMVTVETLAKATMQPQAPSSQIVVSQLETLTLLEEHEPEKDLFQNLSNILEQDKGKFVPHHFQ